MTNNNKDISFILLSILVYNEPILSLSVYYYQFVFLSISVTDYIPGGTRSSWRITVRQLESMIRLSEAMARIHCTEEIQPKHVQEAFRLLNKSIIRVETPEINFEADEPQLIPEKGDEGGVVNGHGDKQMDEEHDGEDGETVKPPPPPSKKIRVTYEQYRKISNVLILHLKKLEDSTTEGIQWNLSIIDTIGTS